MRRNTEWDVVSRLAVLLCVVAFLASVFAVFNGDRSWDVGFILLISSLGLVSWLASDSS